MEHAAAEESVEDREDRPASPIEPGVMSERVHLAGSLATADRASAGRSAFRVYGLDLLPEWSIALMVAGITVASVASGRIFAQPATAGIYVFFAMMAVVLLVAGASWMRTNAAATTALPKYAWVSNPAHRLRVVGWGPQLGRAEEVIRRAERTGGRDVSEPESFRITHASEPRRVMWARGVACALVGVAGLALIRAVFRPNVNTNSMVAVILLMATMRVVWGFVWPTTVRVVPRRIDVLRYPILGAGPPTVQSIDLRTASVLIDLRYGRMLIRPEGAAPGGAAKEEWISGVMGAPVRLGREMGLAVLAAALSSFEAPPVEACEGGAPTGA